MPGMRARGSASQTARDLVGWAARNPRVQQVAKHWNHLLIIAGTLVENTLITVFLGINDWSKNGPFASLGNIARRQPTGVVLACALVLFCSFASSWISHAAAKGGLGTPNGESRIILPPGANLRPPSRRVPLRLPPMVLALVISASGYLLFFGLLAFVLARPDPCPSTSCSPSLGIHDQNLDLRWLAFQSPAFAIPNDPATYTSSTLPKLSNQGGSIAAIRADARPAQVYRVAISAHNLRPSGLPIRIERVVLVLTEVPSLPRRLRVTAENSSLRDYNANRFLAVYANQMAGAKLPTVYQNLPDGHVELAPGETDQLDIQVSSAIPAELRYQVQVTYRIADHSQERTLTIPQGKSFDVMFSDASNWCPFILKGDRLAAQTCATPSPRP